MNIKILNILLKNIWRTLSKWQGKRNWPEKTYKITTKLKQVHR